MTDRAAAIYRDTFGHLWDRLTDGLSPEGVEVIERLTTAHVTFLATLLAEADKKA